MNIFSKVFYFVIGSLALFSNSVFAAAIPFAEKVAKDAEKQGMFEFFDELFRGGVTVVFMAIGAIVFIVWLVFCIKKFLDWKNDKIEKMDLLGDAGTATIFSVVLLAVLTFANAYIAA